MGCVCANRGGVEGDVVGGGVGLQLCLEQTVCIVVEGVGWTAVVEGEVVVYGGNDIGGCRVRVGV